MLSVVVPVYNEEAVVPDFHRRLSAVLSSLGARAEVLYVNDGSTDRTPSLLQMLRAADQVVGVLDL